MALIDDFKARFPAFDVTVVDTYIPIIEPVWPEYYAKEYTSNKEAILNLVAHLITMETAESTAAVKGVQSKTVGSVSVSYATSSRLGHLQDFYQATKYGQKFLFLTASQFGALPV